MSYTKLQYNKLAAKSSVTEADEITPEIKVLLDERIASYNQNPQNVVTWDEIELEFEKKYCYEL